MSKERNRIGIKCAFCKKDFTIRPEYILENNCCSKKCLANYRKTIPKKLNLICVVCNKNFYRKPSLIKSQNQYCSNKCYGISLTNKKSYSICPTCGENFYKKPCQIQKGNCYCSRSCKKNARIIREPNVCCNTCGRSFYKKPSRKIKCKIHFCSIACLDKHRKNQKTVPCSNCNASLIRSKSKLDNHKNSFCSRKCCGEYRSKNTIGKNHPRTYIDNKNCLTCCKEFKPRSCKTKYCSKICWYRAERKIVNLECCFCKKTYFTHPSRIKWSKIRSQKFSYCNRKCCTNHKIKENHPLWKKDRSEIKNQNKTIRFSSEMKTWRKNIFSRDSWQCQLCGKKSGKNNKIVLNAHHIKKYIDFPDSRFEVNNGITLCEKCHKLTYGKETSYEKMFSEMINTKNNEKQKNK